MTLPSFVSGLMSAISRIIVATHDRQGSLKLAADRFAAELSWLPSQAIHDSLIDIALVPAARAFGKAVADVASSIASESIPRSVFEIVASDNSAQDHLFRLLDRRNFLREFVLAAHGDPNVDDAAHSAGDNLSAQNRAFARKVMNAVNCVDSLLSSANKSYTSEVGVVIQQTLLVFVSYCCINKVVSIYT